ncbi:MAG: DNA polymerase-3 subunit beta [Chlamydiales bacterium]|jgi:DNA polymerase-3 subunit beta
MKFIISKNELGNLIGQIQNVVAQKATIPILSNLLIEASNDELVFTATDLTVGMRCFTQAKILEEGATTIPARRFFQLIRELTASNIEINCNGNDVTEVIADTSRFKLNGKDKNEFPALPDLTGAVQFKIRYEAIKEMFFRTSFAVSRDDNRYVLTGVYMSIEEGRATFVGTDGKRLAKAYTSIEIDPSFTGQYILPLKAVEEIIKILGDEGEATVYLMNDKIAVESENSIVISKLLSGDYPNVNRVIPASTNIQVSLHREELITLLRQVSLFTTDTSSSVRFSFTKGELRLMANNSEIGEGKVSMPVNFEGEQLDIAFNPNFFLDILRHNRDETVSLGITDSYNPGVITDSSTALFVIMPMRLNEE